MVEHRIENSWVIGSNPVLDIKLIYKMKKLRNRPISPHLTIYNLQLSSMFSILHRMTGILLTSLLSFTFVSLKIFLWPFNTQFFFQVYNNYLWIHNAFIILVFIALSYHVCNGLRHIGWNLTFFLEPKIVIKTSFYLIICLIVLIINLMFNK